MLHGLLLNIEHRTLILPAHRTSARLSRTRLRALVLALKAAALFCTGAGRKVRAGQRGVQAVGDRPLLQPLRARQAKAVEGERKGANLRNGEILQAFRAAASSTSTGPRPKMSRSSSFWGREGQELGSTWHLTPRVPSLLPATWRWWCIPEPSAS